MNRRGATGAATADVDGDNVNDVVVAAVDDQYIVWFHEDDIRTDRVLWSYEPIVEGVQVPVDTWAGDFDGDGDVDVVCATTGDGKVTWYENLGTSMGDASWATHHIATDARSVKEIFVGDVDDDEVVGNAAAYARGAGEKAVAVGTVKTAVGNVGYASGAAALIKTALCPSVYAQPMHKHMA